MDWQLAEKNLREQQAALSLTAKPQGTLDAGRAARFKTSSARNLAYVQSSGTLRFADIEKIIGSKLPV